jgi:hypothetical protein
MRRPHREPVGDSEISLSPAWRTATSEQEANGRGKFKWPFQPQWFFPITHFIQEIVHRYLVNCTNCLSVTERSKMCRLRVGPQNRGYDGKDVTTHRNITSIAIEHPTFDIQVSLALCLPLHPPRLFRLIVHQPFNLPCRRVNDDPIPILDKCNRAA